MNIERGDESKKYFTADEPVSGGISSGQPSDDIEEENSEYNAISEEEAQNFMERLGRMEDLRREAYKDTGFMKFLLGSKIADLAMAKISQEKRPNIDCHLDERQKELLFWIDLIKKVPLARAIRRDKEVGSRYLDRAGNFGMITNSLRDGAKNKAVLDEDQSRQFQAMGQRSTIREGMAFGFARMENMMRKDCEKGTPLSDEQNDRLIRIKEMSQAELDSIEELIPEEAE